MLLISPLLASPQDEDREARQRVSYLVEELFALANKIKSEVCEETIALLAAAKVKKDTKVFKTSKKELEALYKQLCEEFAAVSVSGAGKTVGTLRGRSHIT